MEAAALPCTCSSSKQQQQQQQQQGSSTHTAEMLASSISQLV
jgi:hypothetical protein